MRVTAEELIGFARTIEGTLITTSSGSSTFGVKVTDKGMEYTPTSTGKTRKQTYDYIKRICDQYSETQSLRKSEYGFTAHATYALALINRYIALALDPLNDMDANIVSLVQALNAWPGIQTVSSCGGHKDNKDYQLPMGEWQVMFQLEPARVYSPSVQAWLSLEALAYGFSKRFESDKVCLTVFSTDPFLNGSGESIYFNLKGKDIEPDAAAKFLGTLIKEFVS